MCSYTLNVDPPIESPEDCSQLCELENTNVEDDAESQIECLEGSSSNNAEEICSKDDGEDDSTEKVCIICDKSHKYHKGQKQKLFSCAKREVIDDLIFKAKEYDDEALVNKINSALGQKKWIYNHSICKKNYMYTREKAMLKETTPKTSWHKKRDIHKIAFEKVCDFVEEFIIKRKKCYLLNQLESIYKDAYDSAAKKESAADNTIQRNESFRSHLEEKLLKHYPKKITMVIMNNCKVCKSYNGVLLKDNDIDTLQKEDILQNAFTQ